MSWIVLRKDWIALLWSRSKSQERLRIPVNFHLNDISSTADPFVTKLGMMMHHQGPEGYARKYICCFQVRVTVRAHMIKYMTVSDIYVLNC